MANEKSWLGKRIHKLALRGHVSPTGLVTKIIDMKFYFPTLFFFIVGCAYPPPNGTLWSIDAEKAFENPCDISPSDFADKIESIPLETRKAGNIEEWFEEHPEKAKKLPEHLKQFSKLTPGDNPVVVIAKLER